MFELKNQTPFVVALLPGLSPEGQDIATVAVKGCFALPSGRSTQPLAVADQQVPLTMADVPSSDRADRASVRYAAEATPTKPATDVALIGHAYAPTEGATEVDVGMRVGPVQKVVRVFGERVWLPAVLHPRPSKPQPFTRIPLVFERAFGGWDESSANPAKHHFEPRNPAGVGFAAAHADKPDGMPLPNLEDPRALIEQPSDLPAPAGFGFIAPAWLPRRSYAGTYDEKWKQERFPRLPLDFDPAFHQASPPEQVVARYLAGDERVLVRNASPTGELSFTVPRRTFDITVWLRGKTSTFRPVMDTFVIEPDDGRAVCVWKTTFPCPRQLLYLDLVRVREVSA